MLPSNIYKFKEMTYQLGLKRSPIFAYRLTVNTNDRFIGLTSIDYHDFWHWAILVAFATKKSWTVNRDCQPY